MSDSYQLPKRGLGKGLNALIRTPSSVPVRPTEATATAADPETGERILRIGLDQIVPSPYQPRKRFNEENLEELVESIRDHGLIQPLVVRKVNGRYELIAGERRFRACRKLQLTNVPVVLREASDQDVLEMALIENLQREDLDPIEEAEAYARLSREFGLKQDEIARHIGKNRTTVSNTMRLLELDRDVQQFVSQRHITSGHAKALLGVKSRPEQRMLADIVIRRKLNVRETEALVQNHLQGIQSTKPKASEGGLPERENSHLKFLEDSLRGRYSTNVVISHNERANKGKIEIEYYGDEGLNRVLELMGLRLD